MQSGRALSILIGGAGWVFAIAILVTSFGLVPALPHRPGRATTPTVATMTTSPTKPPTATPTDASQAPPAAALVLKPSVLSVAVMVNYAHLAGKDTAALANVSSAVLLPPEACIGLIMVHVSPDGVASAGVTASGLVAAIQDALSQNQAQQTKGTSYAAILDQKEVPGQLLLDLYPSSQCASPGQ